MVQVIEKEKVDTATATDDSISSGYSENEYDLSEYNLLANGLDQV